MCTARLIGWYPATPHTPLHLGSYTRALWVILHRRHLFVTPELSGATYFVSLGFSNYQNRFSIYRIVTNLCSYQLFYCQYTCIVLLQGTTGITRDACKHLKLQYWPSKPWKVLRVADEWEIRIRCACFVYNILCEFWKEGIASFVRIGSTLSPPPQDLKARRVKKINHSLFDQCRERIYRGKSGDKTHHICFSVSVFIS